MCIGMCTDMCIDMCIDMYYGRQLDPVCVRVHACVHVYGARARVYVHARVSMLTHMSMHISMHVSIHMSMTRTYSHGYTKVPTHI